ncbi:uncharacterized protein LOC132304941 [Cornus florida]|uniref:uncharacterized protein LOC132304941 n=1 Tax=Cornus florida TaxID=4283 RepID=UPI0028A0F9EE|nr:uncharacterized protein LOC132304941 [Cornus florida]
MWQHQGLTEVLADDKGFFIFKFASEMECNNILANGPCMVMGKPMFLKKWKKGMVLNQDSYRFIPLWIKFYNILFEFWTAKGFSYVISAVGRPLFANKLIETKKRLSYARLCVEVDATKPFIEDFLLEAEDGVWIDIKVEFQWKPMVCSSCQCFGHLDSRCPVKKIITKLVNIEAPVTMEGPIVQEDKDFTTTKVTATPASNVGTAMAATIG